MNIATRTLAVGYDFGSVAVWHYVNSVFMNFRTIQTENSTQVTQLHVGAEYIVMGDFAATLSVYGID
jgi:hypothetical protein